MRERAAAAEVGGEGSKGGNGGEAESRIGQVGGDRGGAPLGAEHSLKGSCCCGAGCTLNSQVQ